MKYTLLSLLLAGSMSVSAQFSLQLLDASNNDISNGTLNVLQDVNEMSSTQVKMRNSGTAPINVMVMREEENFPAGYTNSFCFGVNCYPTTISVSPLPETIAAGAINGTFKADITSNEISGSWSIKYTFYLESNPAEKVSVIFNGTTNSVSVEENKVKEEKFYAFPNPASESVNIKFDVLNASNNKVVFTDLTGKIVREIALQKDADVLNVNLDGFKNGIYFYSLVEGTQRKFTKKLIVK